MLVGEQRKKRMYSGGEGEIKRGIEKDEDRG